MKAPISFFVSLMLAFCARTALGDSRDMPLTNKVSRLPVIAEVRIERLEIRSDPSNKFVDLFCDCEVLQAFILPFVTNRLTLRMNFDAPATKYEGKKAIVFAFESPHGYFSPYGGKEGLILEGEAYNDRFSRKEIGYGALIEAVKDIIKANERTQRTPR